MNLKWVVFYGILGLFVIAFLLTATTNAVKLSTSAEAEAWGVVAEDIAQMGCVIGQGNAVRGQYVSDPVGDVVFRLSDIPLTDWENIFMPYIVQKYENAGVPLTIEILSTSETDPRITPLALGQNIFVVKVCFERLGTCRIWRVNSIVIKVSDSGAVGRYRCLTIRY